MTGDGVNPSEKKLDYAASPPRVHAVPSKAAGVAMWLFLATLFMLFAAGYLAYLMIRFDLNRYGIEEQPGNIPLPAQIVPAHLSPIFIVSTVVVLLASVTIQWAVVEVRREKIANTRTLIWITLGLAVLFCFLQGPGLLDLWKQHVPRLTQGANVAKLIAMLIVVHALHVLGGVVYLIIVSSRAARGVYDHEHYIGIKHAAMYWHFLDIVWLVMYGTMAIAG
jgi:cytochrome c oxidase subunit III